MDRDTLYLDNDEEITSVVDKLKGTDHVSIDLVIPKEALLLQSVVNLKILKKQAENLSKEIVIVTQDKVGKKLAEQVGISVIEKPGQEPKEVRMVEGDAVSSEGSKPDEPIVIEAKDKVSSKNQPEESPQIEMKETASPIEPTAEVVRPDGVVENDEEEISSDQIKDPAKKKSSKIKKWKIIGALSAVAGLILFIAAYIFVPLANVNLTLAAEKKKVDFSFTADKGMTSVDTTTGTIPAREIKFDVEKSQKYPATGKKKVGEKATGDVTISNHNYSTSPVQIVSGTRLVNSAGLVFRTKTNVSVPGYTKVGQVVTDGTVNVAVEADQVGDSYNIAANSVLSIPGLVGSTTADIYGKNSTAFTGGSSKDVQFVTQTDLNSAKEDIKKQIEAEAKKLALEKTEREERYLEGAIKITDVSADPSVAVNGEASDFELKAKSSVSVLVFKDEDLKKLAEQTLGDQIGSGKEIVESESMTSAAEFVEVDFDKGKVSGRLAGEAYVATKIDQNKLKIELTGEADQSARGDVQAIDGVTSFEIKHFPSFYKRMPRIKNHIYIKTTISKDQ
jgi:hypothetical protein